MTEAVLPPTLESDSLDADVVIVGYGPAGQVLAALLGQAGHRVIVLERRRGRYETPRAGHFDHEIMRVFQALGIADEVSRIADPAHSYEFLDPDGTVVARLPRDWDAPSGWEASYHFYQPELEEILDRAVRSIPSVDLRFDSNVVGVRQGDGRVGISLADGSTVTGRFVVGADGANSAVRTLSGIATQDLGFQADWIVADVRPLAGAPALDIPDTGQVLNPARPSHMGRVSARYYRWEFMLVDGDDREEIATREGVWRLLAPWIGPEQGELIRHTIYTFRSVVAETFRRGAVLLAGDAAHVMPPFLGQGMCSGIRDSTTLAWMLDLVLSGSSDPRLLDQYTATRKSHVVTYIEESVRIGTVVCETDPGRAAQRRDALMSATELPPPFQPAIEAGIRAGDRLAGHLAIQPRLRTQEGRGRRADDVLGHGFTLVSLVPLDGAVQALADELGERVGLRTAVLGVDVEEDGDTLRAWATREGVIAVLVRPDFYVFGTASSVADIADLLASLHDSLSVAAR
ncbi:bifunctional 3-(3-hydroxy-phenyl)propionate/3-hydroxycinnamic acid hydroxylase (plasmid) [Herbiconiux sp. KACC 21604]|uniref:bifunctional 3-(3-hydroxy-phenyl)propionate/3-hydroxycinnamic acid hydroxylase MhpA n=1 Tax=unclassified Herbiconiux TaxID=2618217 RepID=UPI001491CA98|nr:MULTISPECIES: bifunctional 3-(3-hydroxy-phenyl)propionate/3-hydroxycinnamic acid hydroxylase [unclassified Herbiconiux]QJU56310.1 bifunctional 3-(3-hydroxy-phenyl)propionate/3-hydroxycinnamic acid hydroxylase [Herbiconiux sp. SALV-R1]WPO88817.1 bifunctional 3-(3-hydroxy-phenyl)propionate/3-hydroxycinnamic acid hydroxylase [Herbiconiux sp. KACC 21604]